MTEHQREARILVAQRPKPWVGVSSELSAVGAAFFRTAWGGLYGASVLHR